MSTTFIALMFGFIEIITIFKNIISIIITLHFYE